MSGNLCIIVGGGLAGHSAAHTVLENGGSVLLLDKNAFCGGNSTKATSGINGAGTHVQRGKKVVDSPEMFESDTLKSAAELARPPLVHALAHESGPAVEWLIGSFGLNLSLLGRMGGHSAARTHRGLERFPGMSITYALMEKFEALTESDPARARLLTRATVTKLLGDATVGVTGVEYTHNNQTHVAHGCVIVCTGGFGADFSDDSLLSSVEKEFAQHPPWTTVRNMPSLRSLPTTNGNHCTGDGIKMAQRIGANVVDMPYVQVHPTGLVDPADPAAKVKWLAAEALRGSGALLLDGKGQRFCDELEKRDVVSSKMMDAQGPFRLVLNGKASAEFAWHCEHYVGRGVMAHFKTGAALAAAIGVPVSALAATFDKYNKGVEVNKDEFGKTYFTNGPWSADDHFHVALITPVIHYTMGGIEGDAAARVLSTKGTAIPGLFVAGEAFGGVHGANRLGGSSLLDCVVFGRIAGRSACAYLLQHAAAASSGPAARLAAISGHVTVEVPPNTTVTVRVLGDVAPATTAALQPVSMAALAVAVAPAAAPAAAPSVIVPAAAPSVIVPAAAPALPSFSLEEVRKHKTKDDCWVILDGSVYNVTAFLQDHPGGVASIMAYAGKDASKEFAMLHKPEILVKYGQGFLIGTVAKSGLRATPAAAATVSVAPAAPAALLTWAEVAKHNSKTDCWSVIHGHVYNLTSFLGDHPGGGGILVKYGGRDATMAFDAAGHPKDIAASLGLAHLCLGPVTGCVRAS